MPVYSFDCPTHGTQDVLMPYPKGRPPKYHPCQFVIEEKKNDLVKNHLCLAPSKFVISPPGLITIRLTWNDEANEARRNPRVQMETQKKNLENERREYGLPDVGMEDMRPAPKGQVIRGKKFPPIVGE